MSGRNYYEVFDSEGKIKQLWEIQQQDLGNLFYLLRLNDCIEYAVRFDKKWHNYIDKMKDLKKILDNIKAIKDIKYPYSDYPLLPSLSPKNDNLVNNLNNHCLLLAELNIKHLIKQYSKLFVKQFKDKEEKKSAIEYIKKEVLGKKNTWCDGNKY